MILAIDIGVDQVITAAITFNFKCIYKLDVPFSQYQKLVELFSEILDTQFDADGSQEISGGFVVQLL